MWNHTVIPLSASNELTKRPQQSFVDFHADIAGNSGSLLSWEGPSSGDGFSPGSANPIPKAQGKLTEGQGNIAPSTSATCPEKSSFFHWVL